MKTIVTEKFTAFLNKTKIGRHRLRLLATCLVLACSTSASIALTAAADSWPCGPSSDYNACINAGYTAHNYQSTSGNSYWREYTGHNCTNYVAYVELQNGSSVPSNYGMGYPNQWAGNARNLSIPVNQTPAVGAAAEWDPGVGGSDPVNGHVAYVEKVSPDGNTITVSEDNYSPSQFDWRVITKGTSTWPTQFIHFKDVSPGWGGVGTASYSGDTLASGSTIYPNSYLASANVQHALVFQGDSNLVLYTGNGVVSWQSGTGGQNANRLVMQTDGNLVMYRADNSVVWQSGTVNHPGAYANLQSDGNLVIRNASTAYWSTGTGGHANLTYFGSSQLTAGQQLIQNQYLRSPDGRYALMLQTDGNVVLYGPGYHVLWTTATNQGDTYVMQTDGNLVLYAIGVPKWNSITGGTGNYAVLQTDGNFVVYSSSNVALWNSGTTGKL